MLNALTLSLNSLTDRRILMVLGKSILLTGVLLVVAGYGLWHAIDALLERMGLGDDMVSAIATAGLMLLGGWILFRILAIAILWVFSDEIVDAVEDRHYPHHAERGIKPNLSKSLRLGGKSALRALGYNLLALPVYLMLLVTGIGAPLVFLGVNALLLGRDLEDMLVARHGEMASLPKGERLLLGLGGTAAMMVPVVNLLIPVIATAAAVHLAHRNKAGA